MQLTGDKPCRASPHLLRLLQVGGDAGAEEALELVLAAREVLHGHTLFLLELQHQGIEAVRDLLPHALQNGGEPPRHALHLGRRYTQGVGHT